MTLPRLLIAKVGYTQLSANQSFVVTNLSRNHQFVSGDLYVLEEIASRN